MSMLLYKTEEKINDYFSIVIPTVREIIQSEDTDNKYYDNVSLLLATPYDMMVQLDDIGIDFSTLTNWDLFCLIFGELKSRDMSLILKGINFRDFEPAINTQNNELVFINRETGAVIDKAIHDQICRFLRKLLHITEQVKKPGNEEARKYMIERARKKQKRKLAKKNDRSQLEDLIVSLVNTSEFHYNYETVLGLTIYQFNESLHQIIKKIKFDKLMIGCYAGTVNMKDINSEELNWISNLN